MHHKQTGSGKWILAICIFTMFLSASLAQAADREKVMMIYSKDTGFLMDATIAREKGYFDKVQLDFESKSVRGGAVAIISAMLSGEIDGAFFASSAGLAAAAKGMKIVQVCSISKEHGLTYAVLKDSPVKSLKDLDGKAVATFPKPGAAWLSLQYDLDRLNIKPKIVPMKSRGEMFSALMTGDVDACYSNPISEAFYGDQIRVAHSSSISKYLLNSCGWWFKKEFADAHPEAVKRFVSGLSMARTFIETNPKEAASIFTKHARINLEKFQKPIKLPIYDNPPVIYAYGLKKVNEILQEYGIMDTKVDVSKIVDGRFARVIDEDY